MREEFQQRPDFWKQTWLRVRGRSQARLETLDAGPPSPSCRGTANGAGVPLAGNRRCTRTPIKYLRQSRAFHLLPSHNNQPPLRSPVTRRPSPCCLRCLPRLLAHVPVTVLRKHRPQYCCPGCEHPALLWPCSLFHRPVPGTASSCAASGAEKEISKAAIWILTLKTKTTML